MAQQVRIAGATYEDVPSIEVPDAGGVRHSFVDTSGATATADKVLQGYTAFAGGELLVGTASGGGTSATWWGGIEPELMGQTLWSAAVSDADNWPLTPSTSAQNLTWTTEYTETASANATVDRIGKGYHGKTETLDFGTYNYIVMEDAFVHYAYTSSEASLGKVHALYDGFTSVYHWGARPRLASGSIVRPSTTTYGSYGSCAYTASFIGYRTAAGTFQLANNASYGVSAAAIAPSMDSTSSVKPNYFNVRTPTFGIRAHNTYMVVGAFGNLDMDETTVNFRSRIYRVPVEYGVYTIIYDRLLDMIQGGTFPTEPV